VLKGIGLAALVCTFFQASFSDMERLAFPVFMLCLVHLFFASRDCTLIERF